MSRLHEIFCTCYLRSRRFAVCYQTVVCPVCPVLSVTLVYCGQTVGRIKMTLGTQVGLGLGHIVLGGDPAPPIFGPYLLRQNGCRDQDATGYGIRTRPRRLCVRWGHRSPPQKAGGAPSPLFGPFLLQPNGWMHQDATWCGGRPHPR